MYGGVGYSTVELLTTFRGRHTIAPLPIFLMPLKHSTETLLMVLLGAAIAVTGILMSALPNLPQGLLPWAILFIASFIYPILLYPLFKRDRADHTFRTLHWTPFLLLILWMILQLLAMFVPATAFLAKWYTWGWALAFVAASFFSLIRFSLLVVRRWLTRVVLLAVLFVLFAGGALMHEKKQVPLHDSLVTAMDESAKWSPSWPSWLTARDGDADDQVAMDGDSDDPKERRWRKQLKAVEERRQKRLAAREADEKHSDDDDHDHDDMDHDDMDDHKDGDTMGDDAVAMNDTNDSGSWFKRVEEAMGDGKELPTSLDNGGTGAHLREVKTTPKKLPDSGFGWGVIATAMLAGYTTTLHGRAKKRR